MLQFTQLELFVILQKCSNKNVSECNPPKRGNSIQSFLFTCGGGFQTFVNGTKAVLTSSPWNISKTAISRCCEAENNGSVSAHVDSCTASVNKRSKCSFLKLLPQIEHELYSFGINLVEAFKAISLWHDLNERDFHFLHWV